MQEGSIRLGTLTRWEHHGHGRDGGREERGWQGSSAPLQPPHPRRAFWGTELALEHPWPPQRCKRRRRRRKAAGQDLAERSKQGPRSASRGHQHSPSSAPVKCHQGRSREHQSRHRLTQLQPLKPPNPFLFPGTSPSCLIPPFLSLPFPFFAPFPAPSDSSPLIAGFKAPLHPQQGPAATWGFLPLSWLLFFFYYFFFKVSPCLCLNEPG